MDPRTPHVQTPCRNDQIRRQQEAIRRIGEALVRCGYVSIEEQAAALNLPRSTTWTVLKANHKTSGLSASIIHKMLRSPELPEAARARILEYIEEKRKGSFGDNPIRLRRFDARLSLYGVLPVQRSSDSWTDRSRRIHTEKHRDTFAAGVGRRSSFK